MSEVKERINVKDFINRVLNGTALGIIIGLIPNAVFASILKYFSNAPIVPDVIAVVTIYQLAAPALIGALIAKQFNFDPMRMVVVTAASFVGSGVITLRTDLVSATTGQAARVFVGSGTGDIINTMLTASVAVILIKLVGNAFGSSTILAMTLFVGTLSAMIGYYTLKPISQITATIGQGINYFTTLQPLLMSILIGCSFALLIVSPLSTVAIGTAIKLSGVSAGAAAMGIAATTLVLIVHSVRVNKSGVTLAIALGSMKMMMPNVFRKPIILVPCILSAVITAIPVAMFSISGTPNSAGFGLVGLVGPLASLDAGLNIMLVLLSWLVVPVVAALVAMYVCEKVLKLYTVDAFYYKAD